MGTLVDLALVRPLPLLLLRGLLFGTFALHMLFVLLTLGTAILGMIFLLRAWWAGRTDEAPRGHRLLQVLLAHKSLAVVLGVAPLLLIQVGFTMPFFTAVNLFAPYWLLIIPLLIAAFLMLDAAAHPGAERRLLRTILGLAGLTSLLAIPGIFVGVLITTEHAPAWLAMLQQGYRLSGALALHWFVRYLHVLGAGVVVTAAFQLVVSRPDDAAGRAALRRWMLGGLGAQVILGVLLYLSIPTPLDRVALGVLGVGILAMGGLGWAVLQRSAWTPVPLVVGMLLALLPMLLTRQLIQDRGVLPVVAQADATAAAHRAVVAAAGPGALEAYAATLNSDTTRGETIYARSCAFCHGKHGDGQGVEAGNLAVRPEVLTAIRTHRGYLRDRLLHGIPGSAMPYFTIFTDAQVDGLIAYLDQQFYLLALPEPFAATAHGEAPPVYAAACTRCHGEDGTATTPGARLLRPPPPNFTRRTLTPARAFAVLTAGYPGTAMAAFDGLSGEIRWGLVRHVANLYRPPAVQ